MRTEKEMMDLILKVAMNDTGIRAVGMNGSRVNANVPKDLFQDYDIVYLVTDMDSFISDPSWINVFGEQLIMQTPEAMSMFPPELGGRFSYLMQFSDGNRIDLLLVPVNEKDVYCKEDKLTKILLDKDNQLPPISEPTDEDYWVKRPTAEFFDDCCNEFWWVSNYVAKGLWREEFLYVQEHLNNVKEMLIQMLEWQVGIQTDFLVSVGKNGKYLDNFLSQKSWQELLSTYNNGNYEDCWRALFSMCDLFSSTAEYVSKNLKFHYQKARYSKVYDHLKHIKSLPRDAKKIY
ncbi:aminoglycoside 6-adenylyltransferase [Peribacillus frigoritolerans]